MAKPNKTILPEIIEEPTYGNIDTPFWDDRPVAIVGGGTSLVGFDFNRLAGAHVLALKGAMFDIPWADAGFGLDMPRFREWQDKLSAISMRVYWACPPDQLATIRNVGRNITFLHRLQGQGISDDNTSDIYEGGTSGFGGLQVAIHKRAKQIYLFGYDYEGNYAHMSEYQAGVTVPFHHNAQHYERKRTQNAANWFQWARYFEGFVPYLAEKGITVVNACPSSAIECFQRMTIDDAVNRLHGRGL